MEALRSTVRGVQDQSPNSSRPLFSDIDIKCGSILGTACVIVIWSRISSVHTAPYLNILLFRSSIQSKNCVGSVWQSQPPLWYQFVVLIWTLPG